MFQGAPNAFLQSAHVQCGASFVNYVVFFISQPPPPPPLSVEESETEMPHNYMESSLLMLTSVSK